MLERIRAEIAAAGGWISFARYMELALHAPGIGYYARGARQFGAQGDFVTAGGRVLGVTATGDSLTTALERCYDAVGQISWEGMQYRRDIGKFRVTSKSANRKSTA